MRPFEYSLFAAALLGAGCVTHLPVAGMTPDMGWRDASYACFHEAYQKVPTNVGAVLLGGMAAGAAGGLLAGGGDTLTRVDLINACMVRHGWQES